MIQTFAKAFMTVFHAPLTAMRAIVPEMKAGRCSDCGSLDVGPGDFECEECFDDRN